MSEQACYEILKFLESLQGEQPELPDAILHYWHRVIKTVVREKPNWNKVRNCCEHITMIVTKLRGDGRNVMRVEKTEGLVSILLGAIHLGQKNYREAIDHFEQGAKFLQRWGDPDFESLAYFGRVLTYKEEENWPGTLEAAQKALDAIRDLPLHDRSKPMKSLQERIKEEIVLATEASIRDAERTPSGAKPKPSQPSRPKPTEIPIIGDIAAGLGRITDENIEDYFLLGDNYRNGADFGVKVMGDSMQGHGILSGDIALIRQQPAIEMGEIAAAVVTTLTESQSVLKQYYHYEEHADLQHWFLKSSNPLSEHLVIIPSGANIKGIQDLYAPDIQAGRIRIYENAELTIVGKYVGLVRNI